MLGPAPYQAFFGYQLPRLASGQAFAFTHNGAHEVLLISRNFSIAGLGAKLRALGASEAWATATRVVAWIYSVGLLVLAWLATRAEHTKVGSLAVWLSLLNLAALRSPMAPSAYVLAPVLWVLALLATQVRGRPALAAAVVAAWIVVVGPPPLPDRVDLIVNLFCQAVAIVLSVAVVCWPRPQPSIARAPVGSRLASIIS